jgi:hypothetical protein
MRPHSGGRPRLTAEFLSALLALAHSGFTETHKSLAAWQQRLGGVLPCSLLLLGCVFSNAS